MSQQKSNPWRPFFPLSASHVEVRIKPAARLHEPTIEPLDLAGKIDDRDGVHRRAGSAGSHGTGIHRNGACGRRLKGIRPGCSRRFFELRWLSSSSGWARSALRTGRGHDCGVRTGVR